MKDLLKIVHGKEKISVSVHGMNYMAFVKMALN